ncbi:MAG: hypothetical protein JST10_00400, partial [Bacteroidetes bacterium]|nr:hypothetical protein [Bacteroidota bacterium]
KLNEITARASSIFTGTDSGIQMQYAVPYLAIEKAATDTHHKNSYPAPSAEDIYQLIKKRKENKDFAGSFIVAFNGEKYVF